MNLINIIVDTAKRDYGKDFSEYDALDIILSMPGWLGDEIKRGNKTDQLKEAIEWHIAKQNRQGVIA